LSACHNIEAEKALLGAMMLDPDRLMPVVTRHGLQPEWFWDSMHHKTAATMLAMVSERSPIDALTVTTWMKTKMGVDEPGLFVDQIVDQTPTAAHGEYYLDIVKGQWKLRCAEEIMTEAHSKIHRQQDQADTLLRTVAEELMNIGTTITAERTNDEIMLGQENDWRAAKRGEKKGIGLETPWEQLTEMLCGLEPGITILAARPSQGKTTIEDQISDHVASQGFAVGRITLDSTADELLARMMCRKAGVSMPKLKFGFAGESQLEAIADARKTIAQMPIFINDQDRELRCICAQIRAWHQKRKLSLVTLDFIQLVEASDMGRSQWDANTRVSYVSKVLKGLSLELRLPFLVLSQLSRGVEKDGREPELSDLRDSGSLEQDAHKVMFVRRDAKRCLELDEARPGTTKHMRPAWIDVLKHKNGDTGSLPFWMYPPYFRFEYEGTGNFVDPNAKGEGVSMQAKDGQQFRRPVQTDLLPELEED